MKRNVPGQSPDLGRSECERIERELYELRYIYDTAPMGLCMLDTTLRYRRINRRLAELNGLPVEAHIGKTVREIIPALADTVEPLLRRVLETGQPVPDFELKGQNAARPGVARHWLGNLYPLKAEDGTVTGINITMEEITERKIAEERLAVGNRRLHEILTSIRDDFYVLDREWRFVFVNEQFSGRIGKRPGDFIGNVIWEMFPKHLGTVLEENFRAAMDGREIRRFEVAGKYTDMVYRMTAFPSAEGITVIGTDITEQKKIENALQASETRFRMLHETLRDPFVQVSMDGRIIGWNDHYRHMLGYPAEELTALTYTEITPEKWHASEEEIVRTQIVARGYSDVYEKEYRRKDGTVIPVELRTILSRDGDGRPSSMWAIVRDISERKRTEADARRQTALLTAINRILRTTLSCETVEELCIECLSALEAMTGSGFGYIGEIDSSAGMLDALAVSDPGWDACGIYASPPDRRKAPLHFPVRGIHGLVITERKALFTNDPASHPAGVGTPPGHPVLTSFLCVPLVRDGRSIGVIGLANKPGGFEQSDLEATEALAPIILQVFSRKRAEDALRIERDKLKAVFDNTPVGIIITDAKAAFLFMNRAALDIHGFSSEREMLARLEQYRDEFELLSPDRRILPFGEWPAVRAVNGEFVRDFEVRLRNRHGGTERYLSYTSVPIRTGKGEISSIIFNAVDLTVQKRAEESLFESELFYRQTLESIPGMVFTTRSDGYCDYQSRQWVEFTGVPMEEHLGNGWNRLLHPDDRPKALSAWRDAVAGKASYDLEYRVRRHDGEYEWFKVIGRPIRDVSGQIVKWFGIAANVDELKKAKDAEQAAKEQAERANRAKSEFLAHMSHEIRTPIAGIIGMTDIISSRTKDPGKKEYLELIRASADSLLTVIGDILDLSRIENGVVVLELGEWEIRKELKHIVTPFAVQAKNKALSLTLNIDPDVPGTLLADGDKMAQVLRNLVSNAIKYTERGSVSVAVVRERETGTTSGIRIEVTDTGIGIEPDRLDAIFESFVRLRKSVRERNVEGTGLGLTITKRLVELMNGSIAVRSEPGKGSVFTVVLELEEGEAAHAGEPEKASTLSDLPPLSILVVEDNRINQMFLELTLREAGHTVALANHGAEALALLTESDCPRFDLVLMDVQMAVMDGIEATRIVRAFDGAASRIPIIALTAFAVRGDEERFREAGMDGYVTKPVDWQELTRVIRGVLEGRGSAGDRT